MAGSYEELEPWYDHLYHVLHAILRAEIPPVAGGTAPRALDAGCGTGFQTAILEGLGYQSHGLDLAPRLLAVTRRKLPRAPLVRGRVEALPYRDGCFDAVSCCGSTLSFVAEPARAVSELGRVLRPGGVLLLECERRWSLDLLWMLVSSVTRDALGYGVGFRALLGQLAERPTASVVVDYPGYPGLRLFTGSDLGAMLREAGLTPVRAWGIHTITNLIPSTILHRPRLGAVLASVYRRLRAVDRALAGSRAARWMGASLVLLARK